jgi:ribosomal protein S18 acetylase RimI-like enzyme
VPDISVREATPADSEFILSLVPRLAEFGPPRWRDAGDMTATDVRVVSGKFASMPEGTAMFVAEDEAGERLGYIHLEPGTDYYDPVEHGHVADLVVAAVGEGRGVARALMAEAEAWAQRRGYHSLSLTVFAQNQRARALYERLGYGQDMMKYVKRMDRNT